MPSGRAGAPKSAGIWSGFVEWKKKKEKKSWFGSFFFVEQEKEDGGGESYGAAATDQYQEHSVCVRCVLIPRGHLAGRASMVAAASK